MPVPSCISPSLEPRATILYFLLLPSQLAILPTTHLLPAIHRSIYTSPLNSGLQGDEENESCVGVPTVTHFRGWQGQGLPVPTARLQVVVVALVTIVVRVEQVVAPEPVVAHPSRHCLLRPYHHHPKLARVPPHYTYVMLRRHRRRGVDQQQQPIVHPRYCRRCHRRIKAAAAGGQSPCCGSSAATSGGSAP